MVVVSKDDMIPSEFNNLEWLPPWSAIAPGIEAQRLKLQLKKEVRHGHPLHGQHAIPLARRSDNDDVLFYLPNATDKPLAVVHLTWSPQPSWSTQAQQPSQADKSLEIPYTAFYSSERHWISKRMIPDHREVTGPNPHYEETVEQLKGMYDGSEPGWVLVDHGPDEFDGQPTYYPVNILTHAVILIEDDDAFEEIVRRMLEAGILILASSQVREHLNGDT